MNDRFGRKKLLEALALLQIVERERARNQGMPDTTSTRLSPLNRVALKFIRFKAAQERTGLSRSTIWRLERVSGFPKHHKISPNPVAWVEQDVVDWMRSKAGRR